MSDRPQGRGWCPFEPPGARRTSGSGRSNGRSGEQIVRNSPAQQAPGRSTTRRQATLRACPMTAGGRLDQHALADIRVAVAPITRSILPVVRPGAFERTLRPPRPGSVAGDDPARPWTRRRVAYKAFCAARFSGSVSPDFLSCQQRRACSSGSDTGLRCATVVELPPASRRWGCRLSATTSSTPGPSGCTNSTCSACQDQRLGQRRRIAVTMHPAPSPSRWLPRPCRRRALHL